MLAIVDFPEDTYKADEHARIVEAGRTVEVLRSRNDRNPTFTRVAETGTEIPWTPAPGVGHGNTRVCGRCFATVSSWGPSQYTDRNPWENQIRHTLWHDSIGDVR